jgi:alginate O-acetyltransferase complex protein AlgI
VSFVSVNFALFLAFGLVLFHILSPRRRIWLLLGLSTAFYATWSPWHTALLFGAVAAVYAAARIIESSRGQGWKLGLTALAVALLVLLLTAFKCAQGLVEFFSDRSTPAAFDRAAWFIAPLGLSFYLFKLIGYLLDVYWERLPAQRSFASLALYAAFFPQIISGPIQRAGDFFTQLDRIGDTDLAAFLRGLRRILFGLFKKVVVADQLAILVTHVHAAPLDRSALELLIGAYGFSLQMYADFSGLTDIAIGIGLLFGITGPENFDRPYFSRNIQEFWRRWHMSLTSWLTDYLFLPLRMALRHLGDWGLALAIFVNMVAVGVWHGPRWTYFAFGCINGLYMIVSVFTLKKRNAYFRGHAALSRLREYGAPLLTFHLMVLTHIFFQASDLGAALSYIGHMGSLTSGNGASPLRLDWTSFGLSRFRLLQAVAGLGVIEMVERSMARPRWVTRFVAAPRVLRWGLYYAVIALVVMSSKGKTSFIYAQF